MGAVRRLISTVRSLWISKPVFGWGVVYLLFAIFVCHSSLAVLPAALPTGTPTFGTVALFNAWTLWWNADRLSHGLAGYWDAPIFWPERGTFALSEPQPLGLLVAPVVWTCGPIVAYHAYLLISVWLNGFFAWRLLKRITAKSGWAGWTGSLVIWLPLINLQPELIQYACLWPILWTWEASLRLLELPRIRPAVELGLAIACTFLGSLHLGVFSLGLLLLVWPWFAIRRSGKALVFLLIALCLSVLLLMPIWLPMGSILKEHAHPRPVEVVVSLSASLSDWLRVPEHTLEASFFPDSGVGRSLNPGWLRLMLAAVGGVMTILCRQTSPHEKRAVLFLASVATLAMVGSFGPNFSILGVRPWCLITELVPGLTWIRSPYRFAYLAQAAILLLAGIGMKTVFDRTSEWLAGRRALRWMQFFCGVLAVGALLEVPPATAALVPAPNYSDPPGWVSYLASRAYDGNPVLILDFPSGGQLVEYDRTVRAMLWQPILRCPLVNGYSGFFPKRWTALARTWRESPYSRQALGLLRDAGVRILLRPAEFPPPPPQLPDGFHLICLYTDSMGNEVWRLDWTSPKDCVGKPNCGENAAR